MSVCFYNGFVEKDDLLSLFTTNRKLPMTADIRQSFQIASGTNDNQWQPMVPMVKLPIFSAVDKHRSQKNSLLQTSVPSSRRVTGPLVQLSSRFLEFSTLQVTQIHSTSYHVSVQISSLISMNINVICQTGIVVKLS